MCIAVPCQIIRFIDNTKKVALGNFLGIKREINVELIDNIAVGDYVIVHVGYAIQKLNLEEALRSIQSFKDIDNSDMYMNL